MVQEEGRSKSKAASDPQSLSGLALVAAARSCLAWHSTRMRDDAEYRAAVRYVTRHLAEQPGRFGQAVRQVVSAHALLARAL